MSRNSSPRGLIKPFEPEIQFTARLIDVACVAIALIISSAVQGEPWGNPQSVAATIGAISFYLAAQLTGLYRSYRGAPVGREIRDVNSYYNLERVNTFSLRRRIAIHVIEAGGYAL